MEGINFDKNDFVTVTKMNHIVEVQHMEKENNRANIRKINSNEYVYLQTGEIKEFNKTTDRSQSYNSLYQTFKKLRYLINNNYVGAKNELHVILTYAENMTDPQRLYDDVRKFMQRLKYLYKNETTIDYINVVEPQERGAWHCHLLLRFNDLDEIYIKNSDMAELWGHGFVKVKRLNNVDNIGAYLSAYLTDVELTTENVYDAQSHGVEDLKVVEKKVDGEMKRFVKGGRIHRYPTGMNIFRRSKGCRYPERKKMRFKDIKKIVGNAKPHYQTSKRIELEDFENTITYIQYNLKRL